MATTTTTTTATTTITTTTTTTTTTTSTSDLPPSPIFQSQPPKILNFTYSSFSFTKHWCSSFLSTLLASVSLILYPSTAIQVLSYIWMRVMRKHTRAPAIGDHRNLLWGISPQTWSSRVSDPHTLICWQVLQDERWGGGGVDGGGGGHERERERERERRAIPSR